MKISVAMCTFNGARFVKEQLESISRQTRLPDELIICDDGSTDDTLNILTSFGKDSPFITNIYSNKSNLGTTKNFEKVIGLCSGEIIVLADQDDVWMPYKVYSIERAFLNYPELGGVFSNATVVNQDLHPLGYTIWDVINFSPKEQNIIKKGGGVIILLKHLCVTGSTLAFRSSMKDRLIPIPAIWLHDAWIAMNISIFSKLSLLEDNLIYYRQHDNNQIGCVQKGIAYRIRESLDLNRSIYYRDEIERYCLLQKHVAQWFPSDHKVRLGISSKLKHLEARNHLPAHRTFRIPGILKELFNGGYYRYSVNWRAAVRDLLIP